MSRFTCTCHLYLCYSWGRVGYSTGNFGLKGSRHVAVSQRGGMVVVVGSDLSHRFGNGAEGRRKSRWQGATGMAYSAYLSTGAPADLTLDEAQAARDAAVPTRPVEWWKLPLEHSRTVAQRHAESSDSAAALLL